ncbi:bifunctional sugar-1-phosphate nucleotidylyltransferase/acetyltransferase [Salarchaeum sp. JOR-1]|uniref:bifunctional sugar-1-phosphate nucleotidylyltransferase/acetyltransferase n=1 Tax=Salarchaeum sp. JOR-1 TaxID=2599399 RepID=UPI001198A039|nr:bifunctional sugar-1-phosphate nucleotidylyltransferase/acetyltransferase [Salarchaeum sp. JOR-1]QDX40798.1 glucose-1-phosphate thymidylyltransferase [Salarchaeum sp. JOR-1]
MQAVVLAAGEGTRLRPISGTRPKPLVPVGGRPLVEHVLAASQAVVDEFVVVVGYRADDVRAQIGDEFAGVPVTYVEQAEQQGTADAVACARAAIDERFLVLNGDVIVDAELVEALAGAAGHALAAMPVENPSNYGVVSVADGELTGLVEKPTNPSSSLANLGVYAFAPSVFDVLEDVSASARGEYEVTDAIGALCERGESVTVVEHEGLWIDVGRPWEVLAATEAVLADSERDVAGTVEDRVTLEGPVVVEEGARVRDGTVIEGPVVVKAGAEVGPNAYVRGSTVIGEDCRIGNAVEVKNSVLLAGATVGHLSYVGDSVLGADVNFGAGTTVANLRHDEDTVQMHVKGERVDTGRRKLGVICGDGVRTGINTSLNAGVKLAAGTGTAPGAVVMEDKN